MMSDFGHTKCAQILAEKALKLHKKTRAKLINTYQDYVGLGRLIKPLPIDQRARLINMLKREARFTIYHDYNLKCEDADDIKQRLLHCIKFALNREMDGF